MSMAPDTCGAAMEVPHDNPYSLFERVERISSPGATKSGFTSLPLPYICMPGI